MNVKAIACAALFCGAVLVATGQPIAWRPIALTDAPAPGLGDVMFHDVSSPCVNESGIVAFHAVLAGDGVNEWTRESIWITDNGGPRLLLRAGETVDLGTIAGVFVAFPRFGLLDDGDLTVQAWVLKDGQTSAALIRVDPSTDPPAVTVLALESDDGSTVFEAVLSPVVNANGGYAFIDGISAIWADLGGSLTRVMQLGDTVQYTSWPMRVVIDLDPPTMGTTSRKIGFRAIDEDPDGGSILSPSLWTWDDTALDNIISLRDVIYIGGFPNYGHAPQISAMPLVTHTRLLAWVRFIGIFPDDLDDRLIADGCCGAIHEGSWIDSLDAFIGGFDVHMASARTNYVTEDLWAYTVFLSRGSSTQFNNSLLSFTNNINFFVPLAREGDEIGDSADPGTIELFEAPTVSPLRAVYFGAELRDSEQTKSRAFVMHNAQNNMLIPTRTGDPILVDGTQSTIVGFSIASDPVHSAYGAINAQGDIIARFSLDDGRKGLFRILVRPCPGDLDSNWLVNASDLNGYVNLWLAGDPKADVTTRNRPEGNRYYGLPDGIVTSTDLSYFVNVWLAGCR